MHLRRVSIAGMPEARPENGFAFSAISGRAKSRDFVGSPPVYLSAGTAKLSAQWLSGETLHELEQVTQIGGPFWHQAVDALGYSGVAASVCALELSLVPLLWIPRTRLVGVLLGVLLHLTIPIMMEVATFNAQMILLLSSFAIRDRALSATPTLK